MAGELPHYSNWIRGRNCAACLGPGPCDPHHAHSGTTYDPDLPPPLKSAGPKRGRSQRSHDKWLIPLHFSCHGEFTDHRGRFRDWSPEERDAWEHDEVAKHRRAYAMAYPERLDDVAAPKARKRKTRTPGKGWSVSGVLSLLRREAQHRPAEVSAAFLELADLIERDTV